MISAPSPAPAGCPAGALRAAAVVLDQELDVRILEFRQRHFGGVLHRLRGDAGIARGRERQDQADLDLPGADRSGCCCGPAGPASGCGEPNGLENWLKLCCTLEHAPSSGAPRIRPTAVRRVAPDEEDLAKENLALSGPTIVSLLLTDRDRPGLHRIEGGWIQAYCRRIVNQNKRMMVPRRRRQLREPPPSRGRSIGTPPRCGAGATTPLDWHYARKNQLQLRV